MEPVNPVTNEPEKPGRIKAVLSIRKLQTELLFGSDKVAELNEVVRRGDTTCVYNNSVNIIIQKATNNRLQTQV